MFQKFMGNKDFHPATYQNLKKVWEAEENEKAKTKRQEELRVQYLKEQELQNSKELLGKAHPLSFMYEPPPGFKKEEKKSEEEAQEKRFEWQRSDRVPPKAEPTKGGGEVTEQPFGVEVRKVKCLKCGNWGHVNTDSICPLFGQAKQLDESTLSGRTIADLDAREDGFIFKQCVLDRVLDPTSANQLILGSDEEEVGYEQELLEQLTEKEKRMLLKKIKKMEKKKHKHKRRKQKQQRSIQSAESDSSGEGDKPKGTRRLSASPEPQPAGLRSSESGLESLRKSPPDGGCSRGRGSSTRGGDYDKDGSFSKGSDSRKGSYSKGSYGKEGSYRRGSCREDSYSRGSYNREGSYHRGSYSREGSYSRGSYNREGSYSRGSYSRGSYSREGSFSRDSYKKTSRPDSSQESSSEESSHAPVHKGWRRSRSPVRKRDTASARGREKHSRSPADLDKGHRGGERKEGSRSAHRSAEGRVSRGMACCDWEHDQHRKRHESRTSRHRHS